MVDEGGVTLERIRGHFDRRCSKLSLNGALFFTIMGSFLFTLGSCMLLKFSWMSANAGLTLTIGIGQFIVGLYFMLAGIQMVHAVVRRLRKKQPTEA
jgi:hypothetical protein